MSDTAQQLNLQALLERGFEGAPGLFDGLTVWWQAMRVEGGMTPLSAALLALLLLAIAYAAERAVRVLASWIGKRRSEKRATAAQTPLRWAIGRILSLFLFALIADGLIALFSDEGSSLRFMGNLLATGVLRARVFFSLVQLLGHVADSAFGATGQSSEGEGGAMVKRLTRKVWLPIVTTLFLFLLRTLLVIAIGAVDEVILIGFVLTLAVSLSTAWIFFAVRNEGAEIARAVFVERGEAGPILTFLCKYWHWFYSGFIVLSDLVTFADEMGLTGTRQDMPFIGLVLLLLPSLLLANRNWKRRVIVRTKGQAKALVAGISALAEGVFVVVAAAYISLSWSQWSVDDQGASDLEQILQSVFVALLTLVVGNAIWRALSAFLDLHAPAERDVSQPLNEDDPAAGGGRLATVYPVLRGAVLFTVYAITIMIALTSMGVQIGPLLAGAGVVGFAIGFGAQTIVKDIISGIFYLLEDAFRLGEYIETDVGKGVVERISLRSVRLRHHRGPVFTIPFGSMGPIQNHSRDWVKVKFTLEVPASEDLERVRKTIKRVGVGLLQDPDIGESFLEPLKSQGAIAMNGPNYVIGVKFSCRPGEQFVIRRKAYVALQKTFAEHGIVAAQPKVIVESSLPQDMAGAAGSKVVPGRAATETQ